MAPVAMPTRVGLRKRIHSTTIHVKAAVAAEMWVTVMAMPAAASAATALPALNPNQPTQSMAAPIITIPGLWGGRISSGKPRRLPSIAAITRAETPQVRWTTSPPAKSCTPRSASQPPPHTQWHTGA